jgi:hypothetical protein
VATFQLEKPITASNGVTVNIKLVQRFGNTLTLGRFRLSVTEADDALEYGAPEKVVEAARAPAGDRSPEQTAAIVEYYRSTDGEFWKRKQALMAARTPLAVDPKLTELQAALNKAEEPIEIDPQLAQMRADYAMCDSQNKNKRLTAVQDLAWALVNSGSFLFNH